MHRDTTLLTNEQYTHSQVSLQHLTHRPRTRRTDQPTPLKVEQAWNGLYPVSDTLSFNNAASSAAQPLEYSTGVCNKTAISNTKIKDMLQISHFE